MKLKHIIVPAAALLVLAACGPTTTSDSSSSETPVSSSEADPEKDAAELALRRLPYDIQSNPGMQGRSFDIVTSATVDGYTFDIETTVEETQAYPGSSVELETVPPFNALIGTVDSYNGYMGVYGSYDTVSLSGTDYIGSAGNYGLFFFENEPEAINEGKTNIDYGVLPEEGKTYKLGVYHGSDKVNSYLYVTGEYSGSASQYLATTKTFAEGLDWEVSFDEDGKVAMKAVTEGYEYEGMYLGLRPNGKYTNMFFDNADPFYWTIQQNPESVTAVVTAGATSEEATVSYALWSLTANVIGSSGDVLATKSWNIRIDPLVLMNIADIFTNGTASGDVIVTYGYVVGQYANDERYLWIRDGNYGMTVYGTSVKDYDFEVGDLIRVSGEYSPYNGLPEIMPNNIEVVTPDADDFAAAVVKSDDPIDLNANPSLTSANISVPVTVDATISALDLYWEDPNDDYPEGERQYTIDITYNNGDTIEIHGEEDKDGKDLLDAIFTTDASSGKNVAVTDLEVGMEVTVDGIIGSYNGYQIINATITPKASA